MKKLLTILMAALLCFSLAACNNNNGGNEGNNNQGGETPTDDALHIAYIVSALGDKSFADSGERGMEQLRSEGYDVRTFEVGDDQSKYTDQIIDAIDQGYNLIIGSSSYTDYCKELAAEYPDVKFVIFDDTFEDIPDNMAVIFYAQNEGSYLVGMMAAGMTKTGTVAVNVGKDNPVIADFVTGYVNGIKDYNEANGTNVKVVKASVGSWNDPATMKNICLDQVRNVNADVFYSVAGGCGDGMFEACFESGTWAIGVDSDQYTLVKDSPNAERADVILTSMLKEVGNSLVHMVHSIDNGEDVWKKVSTLGLKDSSVGYVDNDFFKANVPQELRDAMAKAAEDIKAGTLDVKSYFDFANEAEYDEYLKSVE
jgi:basic membrane protein A